MTYIAPVKSLPRDSADQQQEVRDYLAKYNGVIETWFDDVVTRDVRDRLVGEWWAAEAATIQPARPEWMSPGH